jgi:hypothetical protein
MAEKDEKTGEPRPGYIPRPPSKEDVDRVSGQQGMIADEWAAGPTPAAPKPEDGPEEEAEGQPS